MQEIGTVLRIRDVLSRIRIPQFSHPGYRIRVQTFFHPGSYRYMKSGMQTSFFLAAYAFTCQKDPGSEIRDTEKNYPGYRFRNNGLAESSFARKTSVVFVNL
jgi:hypothetical protein